jgi:hypothetical protein
MFEAPWPQGSEYSLAVEPPYTSYIGETGNT